MTIRVLRVLEYEYEDPKRMAEDMARWVQSRHVRGITMRTASLTPVYQEDPEASIGHEVEKTTAKAERPLVFDPEAGMPQIWRIDLLERMCARCIEDGEVASVEAPCLRCDHPQMTITKTTNAGCPNCHRSYIPNGTDRKYELILARGVVRWSLSRNRA